ncbi:uncharacterized protein BJ171DRAFT_490271 [Polychytrium aggregatum]|uniref:uncharacterized protein n=1 Tax=Polychytrium aggregatum TaxID=110093 RepID=UPI0022FE7CE9|nr:uncharacterized protein BJ171DRAFT_490271 [Polychytrium aggregatum]KAI9208116.1 hypothetical protein BJ171DRAFT_490271 [Polychytrium aggregatum]
MQGQPAKRYAHPKKAPSLPPLDVNAARSRILNSLDTNDPRDSHEKLTPTHAKPVSVAVAQPASKKSDTAAMKRNLVTLSPLSAAPFLSREASSIRETDVFGAAQFSGIARAEGLDDDIEPMGFASSKRCLSPVKRSNALSTETEASVASTARNKPLSFSPQPLSFKAPDDSVAKQASDADVGGLVTADAGHLDLLHDETPVGYRHEESAALPVCSGSIRILLKLPDGTRHPAEFRKDELVSAILRYVQKLLRKSHKRVAPLRLYIYTESPPTSTSALADGERPSSSIGSIVLDESTYIASYDLDGKVVYVYMD